MQTQTLRCHFLPICNFVEVTGHFNTTDTASSSKTTISLF